MSVVDEVNVLIGTAGSGHALVGPQMPHGMVKLGPDTISLPCGGYDYNDSKVIGFSHTHLEGVGGRGGRGNILLTATTGRLITDEKQYASRFSHDRETAEVGYYQVFLEDYGVNVELTATLHAGFHRYVFPEAGRAQILVDIGHTLGYWNNCEDGNIQVVDDTTMQGYGVYPIYKPGSSPFTVYFYIKFDKPFHCYGVWIDNNIMSGARDGHGKKTGAYGGYCTLEGEPIQVKVGISYISIEQARYNLVKEIPDWNFDEIKTKNKKAWDELLGRVKIEGGGKDQRVQFYSALYRSLNQPVDYTEYDWYHSGYSGKAEVYPADELHFYGDDWAIWDTFRTTHPLQTILEPEIQNDMAETLVGIYEQGGWLPMATAPNLGYNQVMIGHNAASVIAGIYTRGFREFRVQRAYEAMRKTATEEHDDPELRRLGTPQIYKDLGYCPAEDQGDEDDFSVSISLELTYADWCTAQMARAVGNMKDYEYFMNRAYNYRNLLDPEVGFMRRRDKDGLGVEPFNPADSFKNGFCECSSWEYTFFVPHDMQGLINLIGGREAFIKKLDDFFAGGHYNYQNETSIQVPFLYNYAGAPWKTQEVVRYYLKNKYNSKVDGLFGEDDAGAMSAWYVFAALGIYPVCPGQDVYVLSSPVFEKVVIDAGSGNKFIIEAEDVSEQNMYIQSATLRGESLDKPWITYDDIARGGALKFKVGPTPNREWGSALEAAPPSMTEEKPAFRYSDINISSMSIKSGETFTVSVIVKNEGELGGEAVRIYANDECVSTKVVFLQPEETKEAKFECRLYKPGFYTIKIDDLDVRGVNVIGSKPAVFEYEDSIGVSESMIPYGEDRWIYASGGVKNIGSREGVERVVLYVSEKEIDGKNIELAPGERREVTFRFKLIEPGSNAIRIGRSLPEIVDIAVKPDERWCTFSTTRAEYYQAGAHLYIKAAGYHNRPEFGILYLNRKIKGKFDVITKIATEENTSPYAPAGIIVKNNMRDMEDLNGYTTVGAMSRRGYFFNCHTSVNNYCKPYKYALGCPEAPYWLKLEKRGNFFAGYYSKDGVDWVLLNKANVPGAGTFQEVGLFVNSASPEMRMVKFEHFSIEERS
ncbi:MAG TPA: GH92 family glycosyl hydrolase [Candidatus Atribacteria bacterium]|nr:GH92 family glycosyl hydrolase [Candidatus Atribacteria bacterium]